MTPGSTRRRSPRQQRSRARVERIFAATRAIIARDGTAAVTTSRIALEAGMAVGSFYQYFPNKEAVLLAIYDEYLAGIRAAVEGFDTPERLALGWQRYLPALLDRVKHAEMRDEVVHELFSAIRTVPRLERIEAEHAAWIVDLLAASLRRLGARASTAKLRRLCRFVYALNGGTWLYQAQVTRRSERAEATDWEHRALMAVLASVFPEAPRGA